MTTTPKDSADSFLNDDPVTTTVPERKKYEGKKRKFPVSLGITEKCLPPMTRRKMAVYELLDMTRKDLRIIGAEDNVGTPVAVPQTKEPPPFEFAPTYQFEDRGEEDLGLKRKTMVYTNDIITYNKAKTLSPKDITELQLDIPTFINGQLVVDCWGNFIKYVWLELHPQNQTNKWRDKTRKPEFKRVDIEYVSPYVSLMHLDLAADTEDMIRKMQKDEIINLAAAFGMSPSLSLSDMKLELRQKARLTPEDVLFKAPSKTMSHLLDVMSAIKMGVVDYNPDKQEYFFPQDDDPFYIVPLDTSNPLEAVAQFLTTSEGSGARTQLTELLEYWKA